MALYLADQARMEVWQLTGAQALLHIQNGQLSVEGYARSLLERIRERDADVHAWVYLNDSLVINQAKALDSVPREQRGPLHGLPVGIKDVMLTEDMPTQYNSKLYESTSPTKIDAAPVATLRASGALIFGKLSTTEFATTPQGQWHQNLTRNARDPARTPGGSSSGSGAAVADFQIPIALGTQTGGSIIRPASFNGCYGWKPTWGVVSREGLAQWCPTLDTCGFFARSIDDLELIANAFRIEADDGERPRISHLRGARIGFCPTHLWQKAGSGTRKAVSDAEALLSAAGAIVEHVELPEDFVELPKWHADILAGEGKSSFLHHCLKGGNLLHGQIRGYVEAGSRLSDKALSNAYDGCARLRPVWDDIAAQYDAVLTPSVPDEAPMGQEHTGDMVPVINIPGFEGENGMPIGLTLVGGRYADRALLSTARLVGRAFEGTST